MVMRKIVSGIIMVLLVSGSLAEAKMRDVKAIGEAALRKGKITVPAAGRDFTKVQQGVPYIPGRLIVRFEPRETNSKLSAMSAGEKKGILDSLGAVEEQSFDIVPGLSAVELPAGMSVEEALIKFNKTKGIVYAEPDYEVKICEIIPNDTLFDELWGLHNTGQTGGTADADIDAPEGWVITTGSRHNRPPIIVAVIDTGVDYTHPELIDHMWINSGEDHSPLGSVGPEDYDGYNDDWNYIAGISLVDDLYGYDFINYDGDPKDDNYHGTHCAGTIAAAANNAEGVTGVSWNVKIMAVKSFNSGGSGNSTTTLRGILYSTLMGADITSNSWGGGGYSQGVKDAIDAADEAGILFVAAAGNSNNDNDSNPHYPSGYNCANIIAVMATDKNDDRSIWGGGKASNYGATTVDIGAPGTAILSTFPTYKTSAMSQKGYKKYYQKISGTSMATPHVSGACALLRSLKPTLSNTAVRNVLLASVDSTLSGLCVSGGRLNLYNALVYPTSQSLIFFDKDYYSCSDTAEITFTDSDYGQETRYVFLNTTTGDIETLALDKVDPSGVYKGTISTSGGTIVQGNDVLELRDGDEIFVDAMDDYDVAEADCNYPIISNVEYNEVVLLPGSQTITFETDEPTYASVFYGTTCGGPNEVNDGIFSTQHSITFSDFSPFTEYYFEIEVTDRAKNVTVDDNNGVCYDFLAYPKNIYVPGDFNTIQEAINDSQNGCIIWVDEGNYPSINFGDKTLTVQSMNPEDPCVVAATIINANGDNYAVSIGPDSELNGFTVKGGNYGGINSYCYCATISNCIIEDSSGDGIYQCYCGTPPSSCLIVKNCIIRNHNRGILTDYSSATIEGNQIYGNSTEGIKAGAQSTADIRNNVIYGNVKGIYAQIWSGTIENNLIYDNDVGIFAWSVSSGTIRGNTIVDNTTGGIAAINSSPTIYNCIVWNHNGYDLQGCSATYSCIEDCNDANGLGNICGDANDPCFLDATNNDYHLKTNSPCVNAGNPDPNINYDGQVDIDGDTRVMSQRIDMGADEYGRVHNLNKKRSYEQIGKAIGEASDGDEIVADPGFYVGFHLSKDVILRSSDPNDPSIVETTIISAYGGNYVVEFEADDAIMNGFTVREGAWGGINCYCSCATIENCIIEDNNNNGIYQCYCGSSPSLCLTVTGCIIRDNDRGISSDYSTAIIERNQIYNNGTEGIRGGPLFDANVSNNLVYGNASGIVINSSTSTLSNNTVVDNTGYGIRGNSSTLTIYNCILWGNGDDLSGGSATFSCIEDCDAGEGNICSDPCFANADGNDFHILISSPCVHTGDANGDYDDQVDIDGEPRVIGPCVDMGADEALSRVHNITDDLWYEDIQPAINGSSNGDVIEVYPGEYKGTNNSNLNFGGKAITVRSIDANDWDVVAATVIDCNGSRQSPRFGFIFGSFEDNSSIIEGLTVTNGYGLPYYGANAGGAIYCETGSPTIRRCIFKNNMKDKTNNTEGGAIATYWSQPLIENCKFYDNEAKLGGAIRIFGSGSSDVIIRNCMFWSNSADKGGAIDNYYGKVKLVNCTIADNSAPNGGGVYYEGSNPANKITNCVLWDNGNDDVNNWPATYSCIKEGAQGTGNMSSDPCFVEPDSNDYHIKVTSPCINAGTNSPPGGLSEEDIDGEARIMGLYVDMGADEVNVPTSDAHHWGLDERSGTTTYDSVDDDDGTYSAGTPSWVDGLTGGAVDFNDTSNYFPVSSLDNEYSSSDTFTVAGWFKTSETSGLQTIVGQWSQCWEAGQEYFGWQVLVYNNKVVARFGYGIPTPDVTGTKTVTNGKWHHFAMVRNGTSTALYVDGEPEDSDTVSFYVYNTKFRIGDGSYKFNGNPALKGGPFEGIIDEVMLFDSALSAEDVEDLYDAYGL